MPVLKELAIAGPVLAVLLFLSHTFLGPDATEAKSLTNRGAWIGAELVPDERWLAKDSIVTGAAWQGVYAVSPQRRIAKNAAVRVRDVFSQFLPTERSRAS
jgi:hypothetical protein